MLCRKHESENLACGWGFRAICGWGDAWQSCKDHVNAKRLRSVTQRRIVKTAGEFKTNSPLGGTALPSAEDQFLVVFVCDAQCVAFSDNMKSMKIPW